MRRALAAAAAALAAAAAWAQPYDPAFRWRTLETPHFRVHFHQGEDALAQAVAREAERAHAILVPALGYAPRQRTEIVLSDDVDLANGSATPLPYDTVRLYASPPESLSELNGFRDWLSVLVFHEYTHILHLDHVGGLPDALNSVFGKLFVPNGLLPSFLIEGLAVLHEGDGDGSPGRNGNSLFEMYVRSLATEGEGLPPLDVLSNPMLEWPRGGAPYALGGRFLEYLQRRFGAAAVAGFAADQGGMFWPWAPSWAGRRWFGREDFAALWNDFRTDEKARAEGQLARVRERPVTRASPLTRRGARVEDPRWSPDGASILYYARPLDRRPGLFRAGPGGEDLGRAAVVELNGTFALRSPREAVVAVGEVWREYRIYGDLWLVDLRSGARRRLTDGERATDPDVAPGGSAVVYVAHAPGGRLVLRRRALRGEGGSASLGEAETLLDRPGALPYLPRVSPDGASVAFELQEGGRRDIAIWRAGEVTRVTDDDAVDLSPAWTPDGRFLLFASDRGGVYNLYAWEAASGSLRQVTNVETGALQPAVSPDGRTIAFVTYSRAGYDLASMPFDPATWLDPEPATPRSGREGTGGSGDAASPTTGSANAEPALSTSVPPEADSSSSVPPERSGREATAESREAPAPAAGAVPSPLGAEPIPSRPYRALDTLGPTFWLPILVGDGKGLALGALTAGQDVVGHHSWIAEAWWGFASEQPGYSVAYLGGWSWPRVDLSSSRFVGTSPGPPDRLQSEWTVADVGLDFTFTRLDRALAFRVGWAGTIFHSLERWDPATVPPDVLFRDGFLSSGSLSAAYTDARRFARSITFEEGKTVQLGLSVASPETGSDFDLVRARGSWAGYLRVPGTRHWVLAARLSGGVAKGTVGGNAPFELGGISEPSTASLLLLGAAAQGDQLRGYPRGALEGDAFALANLELRFPIASPEFGRTTWPVFLRRLHGSVFVDAGDAFRVRDEPFASHPFRWDRLRFGAGAELHLETFLAYYLQADVRIGIARGLGPLLAWKNGPPSDPDAIWQVYVTVGAPF